MKVAEAQTKANEAVQKSAKELVDLIAEVWAVETPEQVAPKVENWIKGLAQTTLSVVSCDTLTELMMSLPPHEGEDPTSH